ncbi:MAG TPA: SdpI family protein [Rhizomicrobium sp.]|nr:SdpI family protein [Rhizomicrobium sp.]
MLVVSAWALTVLPSGISVPIHWDPNGRPDAFASRQVGLFGIPGIAALFSLVCAFLPEIEPRRANLAASKQLYYAGWLGSVVVFTGTHIVLLLATSGLPIDVPAVTLLMVALLVCVLGNFLGKSRSMFFMGTRWPWSLSSELAWEKSNRFAAYVYVATGLATIVALILFGTSVGYLTLLCGIVAGTVAGAVVSFIYWRREQNDDSDLPPH